MELSLEPSPDGNYIIQTITGDLDRHDAIENNIKTHAMGKELGINKYLADLTNARNVDNTFDRYNFAYKDMKEQPIIDNTARVAILVSPEDHSHDFIETVLRNTGQDVKLFTNRQQAIDYLLSD